MSVDDFRQTALNRTSEMRGRKLRPVDNSITVPRFDGGGDLELFLKRFMSVAQYYCWTEDEKLFRLEHSIMDSAQYVLMGAPTATSVDEFEGILQSRFGFASNAEHYRAELSRLRRGTMSIQDLHLEVHRLVNKAFPGKWSTSTEIYARDAFLSALNDPELRRRVLMTVPPPETLASAFDLAVRAITLDDTDKCEHRDTSRTTREYQAASRQYQARVITEKATTANAEPHRQEFASDLKKQIVDLQNEIATLRSEQSTTVVGCRGPSTKVPALSSKDRSDRSRGIICWKCKQPGHKVHDCTVGKHSTNPSYNEL